MHYSEPVYFMLPSPTPTPTTPSQKKKKKKKNVYQLFKFLRKLIPIVYFQYFIQEKNVYPGGT